MAAFKENAVKHFRRHWQARKSCIYINIYVHKHICMYIYMCTPYYTFIKSKTQRCVTVPCGSVLSKPNHWLGTTDNNCSEMALTSVFCCCTEQCKFSGKFKVLKILKHTKAQVSAILFYFLFSVQTQVYYRSLCSPLQFSLKMNLEKFLYNALRSVCI